MSLGTTAAEQGGPPETQKCPLLENPWGPLSAFLVYALQWELVHCQYGHSRASQKPLEKAFHTVSQLSEGISLNQVHSTLACHRQGQEKVWQCASVGLNLRAQEKQTCQPYSLCCLYVVLAQMLPGRINRTRA